VFEETGLRLRVIRGEDEAWLVARAFDEFDPGRPAVLCDSGGSTLGWGSLRRGDTTCGEACPRGVGNTVRFAHLRDRPEPCQRLSGSHCDGALGKIRVESGCGLIVTGGTSVLRAG
jgi:hypothetical protein